MNKPLENIGACVFDAYGTLFDVASAAARCKDDLGDQWEPLSDLWRMKQLNYSWLRIL
jgi:2-haloacid dehalogenase